MLCTLNYRTIAHVLSVVVKFREASGHFVQAIRYGMVLP